MKAGRVIDSSFCLALALVTWSVLAHRRHLPPRRRIHGERRGPGFWSSGSRLTVFKPRHPDARPPHARAGKVLGAPDLRVLHRMCHLTLGLAWCVVGSQAGLVVAQAGLTAGQLGRVLAALRRPDDRD